MEHPSFLLFKVNYLGDAVALVPTVSSLRSLFPRSQIDIVCTPTTASIFERTVPRVRAIPISYASARGPSSLLRVLPMAARLAFRRYDVALLSHDEPKFSMVLARAMARSQIGFDLINQNWGRRLLSRMLPCQKGRNIVDLNYDLVRYATDRPALSPTRVALAYGRDEVHAVEQKLRAVGISPDRPLIVVHPFAKLRYREWGLHKFLELARRLTEETSIPCVIIAESGAGAELEGRQAISGLSIHELAALLHRAVLFVGNNSGPMHIAAAMGTPTLTIQGPNPVEWRVFWRDAQHKRMAADYLPCVPCDRIGMSPGHCTNAAYPNGCMAEIHVDAVLSSASEMLANSKGRSRLGETSDGVSFSSA
jgi:heptosyltransferase-3